LFTDITGSTALRARLGEDTFDGIRAEHDRLCDEAVTAHGGTVVKYAGDGVMAVFAGASEALTAATRLQRAFERRNRTATEPYAVRAGLSTGDAMVEDGDVHGLAVVEAARLCNAAQSGEILCSDLVRIAAGSRGGHRFGSVTERELKGLREPLRSCALVWSDEAVDAATTAPHYSVFGPLTAERDGRELALGGPKERAVLATLLAADGAPVSTDALIDAVWGDDPPRSATRTVHSYIARLRSALGPSPSGNGWLTTHGRSYALSTDDNVDALEFAQLATAGRTLLEQGDPGAASTAFDDALALWRGAPYEGHEEIERCANAARALDELRLVVVEDRFDARLALGQSSELVPALEAAIAAEPLRERMWGQLMLALYRAGRQADALRCFQRARHALAEELGIEPGHQLRELEAAILDQDDIRLRGGPGRDRPVIALPAALDVAGSALVGRDVELTRLRECWEGAKAGAGRLVSIVGPEGIGKTRLVSELASEAHGDQSIIGYARCDAAHSSARALFDQALRSVGSSLMRAQSTALPGETLGTSVGRCVAGWASEQPVLIVLDDLHAADGDVLEVVAEVAGAAPDAAMLVIAIFRTDTGDATNHPAIEQQLVLGGLDRAAVAEICALYGDAWTRDDIDRVVVETSGIPLAVHEEATSWIRDAASRRVNEAASQAQLAEFRLSTSQQAVADEVVGIQRVVEQRRRQLATREPDPSVSPCPYKGLMHFDVEDAPWFFGRERLVAELAAHLVTRPVIAVVGPSGSGKSSLVRAGLLPALAAGALPGSNTWQVVLVTPGVAPEAELDRQLAELDAGGSRRVVVVDQLEELFTLCNDPLEREAFARGLQAVVQEGGIVIVAIRADQLGGVAEVPTLADLLNGNDVLVGPIRERELRDVVARPAERAGLQLEDGLVEEVIADARGASGVLPLVQTALLETWVRRTGNVLTLGGYRGSGGVRGALARLAESTYAQLSKPQQEAARRLLLRLADASDDGALDLRRKVRVDDIADRGDLDTWAAYEQLVQHRLLTATEDTVEVTHEALLREWPRLREWLADDVEGRRLHQRLGESAHAWITADRDVSELLRGARLSATHEWASAHASDLNALEREFLDASGALAGQEIADAHARADKEARSSRRLRRSLVGVAVLLVVALLAGMVAIRQRDRADDSAASARQAELAADASRLSAQALVDPQLDHAFLSSLAAVRLDANVDTRAGLIAAMQKAPNAVRFRRFRDARISMLALSLDGEFIATAEHPSNNGDDTGKAFVLDPASLETVAEFDWQGGHGIAFLANGLLAHVERTNETLSVVLSDPKTPEEIVSRFDIAGDDIDSIDSIATDAEGRYLAVNVTQSNQVPTYVVWRVDAPETPIVQGPFVGGYGLAFTPDGGTLAVQDADKVSLVEMPTGTVRGSVPGEGPLAISPDGALLAATSVTPGSDTVAIYDMATFAERARVVADDAVTALGWGAESGTLLVGTESGGEVWNLDGTRRLRLRGQASSLTEILATPDGEHAYSAALDGTLVRWGLTGRDTAFQRVDVATSGDAVLNETDTMRIGPDGEVWYLSMPVFDNTAVLSVRDGETGKLGKEPLHTQHTLLNTIDWSPDGATFATGGGEGVVRLWDRETLALLGSWTDPAKQSVLMIDFSNDGRTIAVGLGGDTSNTTETGQDVVVLDAQTLQQRASLDLEEPGTSPIAGVSYAPSDDLLAVSRCCVDARTFLAVVDPETGRARWQAEPPIEPVSMVWSPDGSRLALADRRGSLMIVDPVNGNIVAGPSPAHAGLVASVAYAPDGETLFSSGTDGQVRVWRARDLRPIGALDPADGTGRGVPIDVRPSDDGTRLLVAVGSRVWEVSIDAEDVAAHLCSVVAEDLTEADWLSLLPGRQYRKVCPDRS
jgi:DNA-binding SARP family transcriptional activator/class 3 adenylate cyclase/WD40 repeat protein/type II secretory pathway predicted ATPase ExeA